MTETIDKIFYFLYDNSILFLEFFVNDLCILIIWCIKFYDMVGIRKYIRNIITIMIVIIVMSVFGFLLLLPVLYLILSIR